MIQRELGVHCSASLPKLADYMRLYIASKELLIVTSWNIAIIGRRRWHEGLIRICIKFWSVFSDEITISATSVYNVLNIKQIKIKITLNKLETLIKLSLCLPGRRSRKSESLSPSPTFHIRKQTKIIDLAIALRKISPLQSFTFILWFPLSYGLLFQT
jgi:hypothetical protein